MKGPGDLGVAGLVQGIVTVNQTHAVGVGLNQLAHGVVTAKAMRR